MKVSTEREKPSRMGKKPEGTTTQIKPTSRKMEVVIPKPKNFNREVYKPFDLDAKEKSSEATRKEKTKVAPKQVRFETSPGDSEDESEAEVSTPGTAVPSKEQVEKAAQPATRPFDSIKPLTVTPIPRDLPKGVLPAPRQSTNPSKPPNQTLKKNDGPAYKLQSPNYRPGLVEEVADRILATPISVTTGEMFELSPQLKKLMIRKNRNSRVPIQKASQFLYEVPDPDDVSSRKDRFTDLPDATMPLAAQWIEITDMALGEIEVLEEDEGGLAKGSYVHRDVVEMFKQDLPENDPRQKITIVARQSNSLRVIYPKVNGSKEEVEGVLDPGSQIISMKKRIAVGCGVSWDPDIVINMMSANGELNSTLGMARNVPVFIGDMTIYFQIHILEDAPYEMLIGRPFDALARTRIENDINGGQIITMTDPNDGHRCTIGTFARGKGKHIEPPPDGSLEPMDRPAAETHFQAAQSPSTEKLISEEEINFPSSKI